MIKWVKKQNPKKEKKSPEVLSSWQEEEADGWAWSKKPFSNLKEKQFSNACLKAFSGLWTRLFSRSGTEPRKQKFRPVLEKFPAREIRFCFDTLEDAGPLEGIRAGLLESRSEYSFVCAGDMPFVNFRVVDLLFEKADGHDAALPRWEDRKFEPLHAVYSRKLIPEIEKAFEKGKCSVLTPVFEMQDVVFVEVSEIRELDPELRTFANINTVEDMELAGRQK